MSVPTDRPRVDPMSDPLTGGTTTTGATAAGAPSGSGTTSTAKAEASGVASEAAEQGRRVAGSAGEQASQVASEAGRQARDLLHQTRSQLVDQTSAGQRHAASGLAALAEELRGLAEGRAGTGVATDLVHQASQRAGSVGSWLEEREPSDVLREVQDFARRRPVAFLALAAGVGLVAGRLTRGLGAAAHQEGPGSSGTVPTLPATGATHASDAALPSGDTRPVAAAPVLASGVFDVTEEPLADGTGGRTGASRGAVPGWDEPLR